MDFTLSRKQKTAEAVYYAAISVLFGRNGRIRTDDPRLVEAML
jgi:hypothetical protein